MKTKAEYLYIVESEYGLDIKRYYASVCKGEAEASAKQIWLRLKDPHDKHDLVKVKVVERNGRKV